MNRQTAALRWKVHPISEWAGLCSTWDDVNARAGALPFLESAFITPLLKVFGSGSESVAVAWRGDVAVAAGILQRQGAAGLTTFQPSQLPLGAWLLVDGEDLQTVAHELLRACPGFVLNLGLTQLDPAMIPRPADEPRLDTLDYIQTGWVEISGTFEAYWEARGKNLRSNMRKQRNKLDADGVAFRFDTLTRAEDVPAALAEYGRMESAGWKAGMGTAVHPDNDQGRFYAEMLANFCRLGRCRIWRLMFDDKIVAMDLCIEAGGTLVILKTAFDPEFRNVSPAFLMRHEAFQPLFREGRIRRVEFYGRMMEWHTRWTDQFRTLYHANVYRWTMVSTVRRLLKRMAHREPEPTEPAPAA